MNYSQQYVFLKELERWHNQRRSAPQRFREEWLRASAERWPGRSVVRWIGDALVRLGRRFQDWGTLESRPNVPAR